MNVLRKEAKLLHVPRYSTMRKDALVEAIHKTKYKDASTQTDGPYCEPCATAAWEKNLEHYAQVLAKKQRRVVHDGDLLIDQDMGEVIDCGIDSEYQYTRR